MGVAPPGDGGDDVFIHRQQQFDTGDTEPYDTERNCCDSQNPYRFVTYQRNIRDKMRGRLRAERRCQGHGVRCGGAREAY